MQGPTLGVPKKSRTNGGPSLTLAKCLKDLKDEDKPLRHSGLLQFSGMSCEEMVEFKVAWASLSSSRKCRVLTSLTELSEDNLDLDFTAIFRNAFY